MSDVVQHVSDMSVKLFWFKALFTLFQLIINFDILYYMLLQQRAAQGSHHYLSNTPAAISAGKGLGFFFLKQIAGMVTSKHNLQPT